jgi:membrane associated rhomboid family serine protease
MPVHTLQDYQPVDGDQYQGGVAYQQAPMQPMPLHGAQQNMNQFGQTDEDRQDDQFWSWNLPPNAPPQWYHMILLCCCPCFVGNPCSDVRKSDYKRMLLSFIFWISIIDLIYFIVEVSMGGFISPSINPALGPGSDTLYKLGAKNAYAIKVYYHIHRLFVPIIMHAGFLHLFMNLYVQIMMGLGYERNWQIYRVVPIYLISGVAGNLFSCCILSQNDISVGASGAIMGLIGAKVSNVICRWNKIPPQHRIIQVISVLFTIMIIMLWSFSKYIDWASHLGGLLVGFFLGLSFFANSIENRALRVVSILISLLFVVTYFVTLSTVFALVVNVGNPLYK